MNPFDRDSTDDAAPSGQAGQALTAVGIHVVAVEHPERSGDNDDLIVSMLTKCLVTPLKLAKHLDWNSRLGRLGAIMSVDISNHQIGIACAYRRHQPPATRLQPDDDGMFPASSATTITPLPPLPYLSSEAYHASYAFLNNRYD